VVPLPDHEWLLGGAVVDPRWTDVGGLDLPSGTGRDALPVASTEAGGVVTTAHFRGSCPCRLRPSCPARGRDRGTEADRFSVDVLDEDGQPRFSWDELRLTGTEYTKVLVAAVMERRRRRARYDTAKQAALEREGLPVDKRSATTINAATNAD
jgi:hypothetical protein